MHVQTHVLSGWCFGNLFSLTKRERFLCILAGSLYDLDGLGIVISREFYWDYHHLLGHNIFFILLLCSVLTFFSQNRIKAFIIYLILSHMHLVMDYYGSGPGWTISYLWPLSDWTIENYNAWPFYSWQNIGTGFFFILWMLLIIFVNKRTFFEFPMPSLDRQIVELSQRLKKRFKQTSQ